MTKHKILHPFHILIGLIAFATIFAIIPSNLAQGSNYNVVSTFHSLSLYWSPSGGSADRNVSVQYRPTSYNTWYEGYPMWYSRDAREYRSSLVHLAPNTEYEIQLTLDATGETITFNATTWSEEFPIARVVELPEFSNDMLRIDQSGSPDGYILYTTQPGKSATIDVQNDENASIYLNASYIIIRGLTLRGGIDHGIRVGNDAHDIVIEDNDISGWGRFANGTQFGRSDNGGVYSSTSSRNQRFIIQRNTFHHPRTDTNSWGESRPDVTEQSWGTHPGGPAAIYLYNSGGNHVIRYNTIYSSEDHQYNDCIGGGANFSDIGSPNRDSDIYGNYISHCWDNGIEAEGGNRNVRIWGNYFDLTYHAIANRDTNLGPLYIWRNVNNSSNRYPRELYHWDDDPRGSFQKSGGEDGDDNGVFVFHNTLLQMPGDSSMETTTGVRMGTAGPMRDTTTRNNIFHVLCSRCDSIDVAGGATTNDFDYDLYNGRINDPANGEANGFYGTPIYTAHHGFVMSTFQGIFTLAPESLGYDQALPLPNFSEGYITGDGPDVGAHEAGMPPMEFGTTAYLYGEPYGYMHSTQAPTTPTPEPTPDAPVILEIDTQNNIVGDTTSVEVITESTAPTLTFSATGLPDGMSINESIGIISGTLSSQSAGDYTVTITVHDDFDQTGEESFQWIVTEPEITEEPAPDAPDILPIDAQNNVVGDTTSVEVITESTAPTLTFSATGLPDGMSINESIGIISGTLSSQSAGDYTVTITVHDDFDQTDEESFNWVVTEPEPTIEPTPIVTEEPAPDAPDILPIDAQNNVVGDTTSVEVITESTASTLTFSANGLPDGMIINPNSGTIAGTLSLQSAGSYTVTITVHDDFDQTDEESFNWIVTEPEPTIEPTPVVTEEPAPDAPVIVPIPTQSNTIGDAISLQIIANSSAPTLTYFASGLPDGITMNQSNGIISGTLSLQSAGSYTAIITVRDNFSQLTQATFQWNITGLEPTIEPTPIVTEEPAPDAPDILPIATQNNVAGDAISLQVIANSTASTLTYFASGLPAGMSINQNSGLISGTLAPQSAGDYSVTIAVRDNVGQTAQATFQWIVTASAPPQDNPDVPVVSGNIQAELWGATDANNQAQFRLRLTNNGTTPQSNLSWRLYFTVERNNNVRNYRLDKYWDSSNSVTVSSPIQHSNNIYYFELSYRGTLAPNADWVFQGSIHLANWRDINTNDDWWKQGGFPNGYQTTQTIPVYVNNTLVTGSEPTDGGVIAVPVPDPIIAPNPPPSAPLPAAPTIAPIANQTSTVGASVTLPIVASTSTSQALSYSATGLPSGLSINAQTGVISGTISGNAQQYSVSVAVRDVNNQTSSSAFAWTVNAPQNNNNSGNDNPSNPPSNALQVELLGSTDSNNQAQFRVRVRNTGSSSQSGMSWRLYFTVDEGYSASDYRLDSYWNSLGNATISAPTQASGNVYYFTVSINSAIPANGEWIFQGSIHLANWQNLNTNNDWWKQGGFSSSYQATTSIPLYQNGSLVVGSQPN